VLWLEFVLGSNLVFWTTRTRLFDACENFGETAEAFGFKRYASLDFFICKQRSSEDMSAGPNSIVSRLVRFFAKEGTSSFPSTVTSSVKVDYRLVGSRG
jgi:hypothetical protein